MALSAGTRLGPYEILEPLGAGGMGEVYRARDTRLDRTVAIKVLPEDLAADSQLKARFEREARAISALAHPNICTLHDVGEERGQTFLVMEHLVGQTLAERLKKGPLPLDQALEVATQIADALAAAHKQGIVHRDLKPGNVMLTKTGARLLDFGLARLTAHGEQPAVESLTSAPTEAEPLTGAGTVMGTLPYMAPEQVEGRPADARTDLWALGTILYEMVTGGRAFEASTPTSLVGAILERDPPPLAERQPLTPPSLERLVRRCLAKDPDERWDTAHDVADELGWIAEADAASEASRARGTPRWVVPAVVAAVVTAALASGLAAWSLLRVAPRETRPVARVSIGLRPGERLGLSPWHATAAISPDGSRLAYVTVRGDWATRQLYFRALDQLEPILLPGTEGAEHPFFSPDGRWVGFRANDKLKKVSVTGGAAITLCDAVSGAGATWAPDDTIIFARRGSTDAGPLAAYALWRVPGVGGTAEQLTVPDSEKRENAHLYPQVLPGGKWVLFSAGVVAGGTSWDAHEASIELLSLETGERRVLRRVGNQPHYAPTGHLVFVDQATLFAAPFDLERLKLSGAAVPVLHGVLADPLSGAGQFGFSKSGTLVYVRGDEESGSRRRMVWVDREGREEPFAAEPDHYFDPRISPDGSRVALTVVRSDNFDVWIYDLARGTSTRLTFDPAVDQRAVWTPDGQRLVFESARHGAANDLFWKAADGTGQVERLTASPYTHRPHFWTSDGELVYEEHHPKTVQDFHVLSMEGERPSRPLLTTPFTEDRPALSPDGRWMAYRSLESGRTEVYVRPFPNVEEGKWQVSRDGGMSPVWGPNGRELFYRSPGGGTMMVVPIETEPTFTAGTPEVLFTGDYFVARNRNYDISPDGQRFLMLRRPETQPLTQLHVVFNWFEELKAKMHEAEQ
jgi:serine/threonine-protein kinase